MLRHNLPRSLATIWVALSVLGCHAPTTPGLRDLPPVAANWSRPPVHAPALAPSPHTTRLPVALQPAREPGTTAVAQTQTPADAEANKSTDDDEWRFVIAPYGWALSVDGNATIRGNLTEVDQGFDDILDQLSFVVEVRTEAWKGRWGTVLDLTYSRLEADAQVGPISVESESELGLVLIGAMHRFVDQEVNADGSGGIKVDGIFGVAYTTMDTELDFPTAPGISGNEDWFDPVFGLRTNWNFSENWAGQLESVIGGFELFNGADLFTMFTVLIGREFGEDKRFYFGWRSLDLDYDKGSTFELDLRLSGPIVGLAWTF